MADLRQIMDENADVKLLDGHLVDVQGTLLSSSGELNKKLYDSMLNAHDNGEKIYIYSSLPNTKILQDAGVDTEKFEVLSKSSFQSSGWSKVPYTIVTGKIIDDNDPEVMHLIMTDPNGWIYPNKSSYNFERTKMPEDLAAYYQISLAKEQKREMRQAQKEITDPLQEKQDRIEKAISRVRSGMFKRRRREDGTIEKTKLELVAESKPMEVRRKVAMGKTGDAAQKELAEEHKLAAEVQTQIAKRVMMKARLEKENNGL